MSTTSEPDRSDDRDGGDLSLEEIGRRIRQSSPPELVELADRLEALDRQHEIAHASDVVDADREELDERIRLYPSQLRVAVDNPTEDTTGTLGNFAHLVETSHDGDASIFETEPIDVWTSPYEHVDELVADYAGVAGELPESVEQQIRRTWVRGHAFRLRTHSEGYTVLRAKDEDLFEDVAKEHLEHNDHYTQYLSDTEMRIKAGAEGEVKQTLHDAGYPPIDERDLETGEPLDVELRDDLELRDYQREWRDRFLEAGSGVIDAPPGSGKTIAALSILADLGQQTLILAPSRELVNQWYDELTTHLELPGGIHQNTRNIGRYHGGEKNIRPITIATYDIASKSRHGRKLFDREWGLVVFDEAHHVPAEIWRRTTDIQSRSRLGLTATPVRSDGKSEEIFTLIGRPVTSTWEELYADGWVNRPDVEVRFVPWATDGAREDYRSAEGIQTMITAAQNPAKLEETRRLVREHTAAGEKVLIYCGWRDQGDQYSDVLDVPFISGETSHDDREDYYAQLREGDLEALIVSRIADEGIDLPDVDVVIIASMLGGSRRQGTQRVGRVMRPLGGSQAYLLATRGSREEEYARSQMDYLRERGTTVTETEVDS
ncbi:DEAD/DEAH box helicase [Natrinema salsiterrestre]|uniref:DNA 3'-5' helicase n=1 Tax=Natrinema salsiterrestre TaxID=2950540 RepID=A0A9Q4L7M6_9EURY|nr:DEAD/DEAH box helicase [Natrinema salsiterrestre]MDF9748423.1 DEAD/DEAH box helicase [Natrinema salsiterrestre]